MGNLLYPGREHYTTMTNKTIFKGQWFLIMADSLHGEYFHCDDEVLVVPLTQEREVILTSEPSAAFAGETLILPGGATEEGEPLAETANRELREEVGLQAARLEYLAELRPFSKYLNVRSHIYLARDLTTSPQIGDESYEIRSVRIPLSNFEELVIARELLDARVIAALYLARSFLNGE